MSEEPNERIRLPAWHLRLDSMLGFLLTDLFPPDEEEYAVSRWAAWEDRIQHGHSAEEAVIEKEHERRMSQPTYDPDEYIGSWAGEDYLETCRLTSTMRAALVVAIWSEMEHFLKDCVLLCWRALDKRTKLLRKVQRFCQQSLEAKKTRDSLKACVKALKELGVDMPFAFEEIEKTLKKEVGIELCHCAEYATIHAIRILNNCFKHNSGRYEPQEGKPHTRIDKTLLDKWSDAIRPGEDEIDYSYLPIRDLVIACNAFCTDLLNKIGGALDRRNAAGRAASGRSATRSEGCSSESTT